MLTNIRCLIQACKNKNINFTLVEPYDNLVEIELGNKRFHFANWSTPLNRQSIGRILTDKGFFYALAQNKIKMPKTKSYLDPFYDERYDEYKTQRSYGEIVDDVANSFKLPVIIKRNGGSAGHNVFVCENEEEIETAIKNIFNQKDSGYDYVCLAQEYIDIKREFRVIVLNGEIQFMYEKDTTGAQMKDNLSPLHWEDSKSVLLDDKKLEDKLNAFIKPLFDQVNIAYTGLDIVKDSNNQFVLIEANSSPSFDIFVRDNGEEEVVELYEEIVSLLGRNVINLHHSQA